MASQKREETSGWRRKRGELHGSTPDAMLLGKEKGKRSEESLQKRSGAEEEDKKDETLQLEYGGWEGRKIEKVIRENEKGEKCVRSLSKTRKQSKQGSMEVEIRFSRGRRNIGMWIEDHLVGMELGPLICL